MPLWTIASFGYYVLLFATPTFLFAPVAYFRAFPALYRFVGGFDEPT